ncbi:hypothetical protein KAR91_55560 [Candidatus Pacearchaeota archaeon]|nr:hypothetical protein [Candidatus Pacearchaeota archaeon]
MNEWIKGLESNAKKQHKYRYKKGNLYFGGWMVPSHIDYDPDCKGEIELKGDFTIQQLQDLVNHMKKYKGK